ncbi:unnamed protein product, partial [marine sediment metagenome]
PFSYSRYGHPEDAAMLPDGPPAYEIEFEVVSESRAGSGPNQSVERPPSAS